MIAFLKNLWATEPTMVIAVLGAALMLAATQAGIVVAESTITEILAVVLPLLLGGGIRSQVSPA